MSHLKRLAGSQLHAGVANPTVTQANISSTVERGEDSIDAWIREPVPAGGIGIELELERPRRGPGSRRAPTAGGGLAKQGD